MSEDLFNMNAIMTPVIGVVVLIFMMVLMVYFYNKHKVFLPIITIFLFSLIIGITSLSIENFPFTPYFQTFFIVFQMIFLLLTTIQMLKEG